MSGNEKNIHHAPHVGVGNSPQPRIPNENTQSKVLSLISSRPAQSGQSGGGDADVSPVTRPEGIRKQLSLPKAPSGLSATAVEFVPMSQKNPKAHSATASHGINTELSADAPGFYAEGQEGVYLYNNENDDYYLFGNEFGELTLEDQYEGNNQPNYDSHYSGASIEERFNLALNILTTYPTNVEEYLQPICDDLAKAPAYETIVSNIVESLYQQCIREDNFRYFGARICQYLNSHIQLERNFIKRFVSRCKVDFDKRDQLVQGSPGDKKKLQGLGMLLAEIFLNVETSAEGSPQHLAFLPSILVKIVQTLLSAAEDNNVKCGCNILKLAGSLIEDVVKTNPDDCVRFEGLFDCLQKLLKNPQLSESAKFHVEKMIKSKENSWTSSLTAPSTNNAYNPYSQNQYHQGGSGEGFNVQDHDVLYYDLLNKEDDVEGSHYLTEEEERDFLAFQNGGDKPDPEMDELDEAYEEFLSQQTENVKYQVPAAAPTPQSRPQFQPSSQPPAPQDSYQYQATPNHYSHYFPHDTHYPPTHQPQQQQHQHQHFNAHQQQQHFAYNNHQQQQQQHHQQQQQHHQQQHHQQQQQHPYYYQQPPQQSRYPSQHPPSNDQFHYRK